MDARLIEVTTPKHKLQFPPFKEQCLYKNIYIGKFGSTSIQNYALLVFLEISGFPGSFYLKNNDFKRIKGSFLVILKNNLAPL